MQAEVFLKKVKQRAELPDDNQARVATDAVFDALRARISHAGGDNIAEQFPKELRDLWESGIAEHVARGLMGVERMDLSEFLGRVQRKAHLADHVQAEKVTRAVFQTMSEQISAGALQAVATQLPVDIRNLWIESTGISRERHGTMEERPELLPEGQYDRGVHRTDDQIAQEVSELLEASEIVDSEMIDVEVDQCVVFLSGAVKTPQELDMAAKIASQVRGVRQVVNELSAAPRL